MLDDACAHLVQGRDYFSPELIARVGHATPPAADASFYVRHRRQVVRTDGHREWVEALITPGGRLVVRTGDRLNGLANVGAALGFADVDMDGEVELITSAAHGPGDQLPGDQLRVMRITADGGLRSVWSSERVEGSVMVAGSGDLDGDGIEELLAIEERTDESHLWVVQ